MSCLVEPNIIIILIVCLFLCSGQCQANLRQVEKRILDDIIGEGRYDSRIRPSGINGTQGKGEFGGQHTILTAQLHCLV